MHEGFATALLWLGFGGSHVALTHPKLRRPLVARLGETGFVVFYSLIAVATFAALIHYVALHQDGGAHAPLTGLPPVRGALVASSALGFALVVAAVVLYPRMPMAAFRHRVVTPRGIQQLTRHPFFSGVAIWAAAHTLLARSPSSFVFFAGMVVLSVAGGLHQDRRLTAELGESYRSYVAATSFVPFVALATKRQAFDWRGQPWLAYGIGLAVSLGLYEVHDHIFDHGGAYVIGVTTAGSAVALVGSRVRASRRLER